MRRWFVLAALLLASGAAGTALFVRAEGRREAPAPEPKKEAPEPPRTAPSRISQVTVYQNTALVTREVEVPAGTGTLELVVTPLPPTTVNNSLYSEGTDGVLVLATRFRTRAIQEKKSAGANGRDIVDSVHSDIRRLGGIVPPRTFVFMDRAAIGLGSVFLHLRAKINWYQLFHELIDDFDEGVLARRQRTALKRAGVPTVT